MCAKGPLKQFLIFLFSRRSWTQYIVDHLVGLLSGFYNVKQCDKRDKKEILDYFQKWRLRHESQTS